MKKLLISALLLISSPLFADTAIYNMSEKNSLFIKYRICDINWQTNEKKCYEAPKELIVNSNNISGKNYAIIKPTLGKLAIPHYEKIEIISAVEEDINNNIISRANYAYPNKSQFDDIPCGAVISSSASDNGQYIIEIIILNDMKQSPYIMCTIGGNIGLIA